MKIINLVQESTNFSFLFFYSPWSNNCFYIFRGLLKNKKNVWQTVYDSQSLKYLLTLYRQSLPPPDLVYTVALHLISLMICPDSEGLGGGRRGNVYCLMCFCCIPRLLSFLQERPTETATMDKEEVLRVHLALALC